MKKMMTLILTGMYILMLGFSLMGCGQQTEAPPAGKPAVGYIIANTACSQGLNLSSPLVQDTAQEAIEQYGWVTVVNADGTPEIVADQNFDIDDAYKSASKERLKMDARNKASSFLKGMGQVIADSEEVDYLISLQLCARNLSALTGFETKSIIVVGTGLSTCGVLDFRNNLLSADPQAIADALAEQGEIPMLEGICVYWQQLGDTAPPQEPLSGSQRQALREIWQAIILRGGGEVVFDEMVYKPVSGECSYPQVSVVALPEIPVIHFDPETLEEEPFSTPVSIPEEQLRFVPDSARYMDEDAAREALIPIAEVLRQNRDIIILLCGCIAGDGASQSGQELSLRRAETVKQTLMALDVPESQLIIKGLGTDNPWHIPGVGYEGELASQNRKVVLVNVRSELGQELLNR